MELSHELIDLSDDGTIPNSRYPVVVYRGVFDISGESAADFLKHRFFENGWSNAFCWGIYDFHHYHTNTHEVLGVYTGNALLQLGGPNGEKLHLNPGDVILLPAGTGHISLSHSDDFAVVGAYPEGVEPDLVRLEDKRPESVREKVDNIPIPKHDPFFGDGGQGMMKRWVEY